MEKNYQGLAASQLILSKQLHDFGNHLKTLEALTAESPKAQQYISQLLSATYKNMPRCRSGNDIIDAIVNCKAVNFRFREPQIDVSDAGHWPAGGHLQEKEPLSYLLLTDK